MMLEATHAGVDIDHQTILLDESVTCRPGAMTALVGPSGSGKTTLLHCLGLLQVPTSGHVLVDGADSSGWTGARRRRFWRGYTSFVLQDYGIMLEESVAFNVTMSGSIWGRRVTGDAALLREALQTTGLAGRDGEQAAHLSGGERQRLAIARATYKRATVLLVDEPTASLDDANRDMVIGLLRERARQGCTVVVATHDPVLVEACHLQHVLGRHEPVPAVAHEATRA